MYDVLQTYRKLRMTMISFYSDWDLERSMPFFALASDWGIKRWTLDDAYDPVRNLVFELTHNSL